MWGRSHSIICGLLAAEPILGRKTEEFRKLYEEHTARGARAVYDAGLAYLEKYYERSEDFDATSIPGDWAPMVHASSAVASRPSTGLKTKRLRSRTA